MTFLWLPIFYAAIAAAFVFLGGLMPRIYLPGDKLTSAIQHFAAGIVFAAVAIELLPRIAHHSSEITVAVGFSLGVAVMLFVKWFTNRTFQVGNRVSRLPLGLLVTVGIDLLIDGLLIGVAFLAGQSSGIMVAVALTIEVFFLGLSSAVTLQKRQVGTILTLGIVIAFALLIPLGTFSSVLLLAHLPQVWTTEALAFGVAALLYLVTEELLLEAHEIEDTPWVTAMFFFGFLIILILKITNS